MYKSDNNKCGSRNKSKDLCAIKVSEILHILTQLIQISCFVIYFCAQAVFKVPFRNSFPTQKWEEVQIMLVLDVLEGVKLIWVTESFRQVCALVSLANIFQE